MTVREAPVCCVCAQASSLLSWSFDDGGGISDVVVWGVGSSILYCCC